MIRKAFAAAVVAAALLVPAGSHAESVCVDAGATNPLRGIVTVPVPAGFEIPAVCVPVP